MNTTQIELVLSMIRARLNRLVRLGFFAIRDLENLEAELLARVFAKWGRYDPARGTIEAFVNVVIESELMSLLRQKNAQKRRARLVRLKDDHDFISDRGTSAAASREAADLRQDLIRVLQDLTPRQRAIADGLRQETPAGVSRRLGIPRRTVRDEIGRIRTVFRDRGLETYL